MKNNIKKELIIALKYVCPKLGYGFLGLGLALLLTQPGKMADILFSVGGVGLLGFTLGALLFYVIGDLGGNYRYTKLEADYNKLEANYTALDAKYTKLKTQNQNLRNIIANSGKKQPKAQVPVNAGVPEVRPNTQPKLFDFEAEYEDNSMEEEPVEETINEPAEEVADEQIPEPAEEEKANLQESPES